MVDHNTSAMKQRVAELLLEELKAWKENWYYISIVHIPTNTFRGGILLKATGPTHAWIILHGLNVLERDCETATSGPVRADVMAKIQDNMRWRLLTREEAESLGK